ncbi:MAG TPA: N-acetylmuramoyl-L-alanine amidase [Chitinophagaceae bacterium]|nr:N-acetylmuramoyl-L-alanine amidase [Chitinophagaceae bacterium]
MTCKNQFLSIALMILLLSFRPFHARTGSPSFGHKFVVCIDPGHGGHDFGARGNFSYEKNITLSIALKLGKFLEETQPDIQVVYTRTTDVFIPLYERSAISNQAKADLFISIHCNSSRDRIIKRLVGHRYITRHGKRRRIPVYRIHRYHETDAQGVETYVLRLGKMEEKTDAIENFEEGGGDSTIIIDSGENVEQAENASIFQEKNYREHYNGYDPSNPASFVLLQLTSSAYQQQSINFANMVQQTFLATGRPSRDVKQMGLVVLEGTAMPSVLIETGFINNPEEEQYLNSNKGQQQIVTCIASAIVKYKDELSQWKPGDNPDSASTPESATGPDNMGTSSPQGIQDTIFRIQFLVSSQAIKPSAQRFKKLGEPVTVETDGIHFRYLLGRYSTRQRADRHLEDIRLMGFRDAYVVAYQDGIRVSG